MAQAQPGYIEGAKTDKDKAYLQQLYGVAYYAAGERKVVEAKPDDLYYFKTFVGEHQVSVQFGDCVYWLSDSKNVAHLTRGPAVIESKHIATIIRGYMPEDKSSGIVTRTNLPYVNGCSTKQVFAPERLGDPTLQILDIPPFSSEQCHHIHPTVRVVYVLSGRGRSVVGMENNVVIEELVPGKVCVLEKMCPHHFETEDEHLLVMPLHVFSSVPGLEKNHPMFNGTHMT